jgi:hypothetical protein
MNLSPASETMAYRIWGYCNPLGWGQTCADVAQALDVSSQRVASIMRAKNWHDRFVQKDRFSNDISPVALADDIGHAMIQSRYAMIADE